MDKFCQELSFDHSDRPVCDASDPGTLTKCKTCPCTEPVAMWRCKTPSPAWCNRENPCVIELKGDVKSYDLPTDCPWGFCKTEFEVVS